MRIEGHGYGESINRHYHDGSTCHGHPTLESCSKKAIANHWAGKILEREDTYADEGDIVKCYSLINDKFTHWSKHGRFVGEIKLVFVPL